ncbi:MAG: hypothetical protein AB1630_02035 [bacterium]
MERLKLSNKAKESIKRLVNSKDSEKMGYIAAIEPQTGEVISYGKSVAEASKEGRRMKNDPKAVFFFVKIGYPAVHVLKSIKLEGYIDQGYFPKVKGYIHNRNLHLASSIPAENIHSLDFIADTGFSGFIVLDTKIIQSIERDYIGEDTTILAGGREHPVSVYLSDITVNSLKLNGVEIIEMEGEYLTGIALMKFICKRAIFAFDKDEVLFED